MSDTTTETPTTAEQENWESRYQGLQKVVAKRDTDLTARQAELDALKAEHEAAQAELSEYRQKQVDASEEDAARQSYEALKARFEPPPPKTQGANPQRDWTETRGDYATRERTEQGARGFPI